MLSSFFHRRDFTTILKICIAGIAIILAGVGHVQAQTSPETAIRDKTPDAKAFINARIVVSADVTYDTGTLLIENGRVVRVGSDVVVPDGVAVYDLHGLTIYPGFIEPFCDYGLPAVDMKPKRGGPLKYDGTRIGGNAWNDAVHSEIDWVSRFTPDAETAKDFMRLGFAAVQSACPDGIFRGRSFTTLLGDGLPNDLVLKPSGHHWLSFDKGSSKQEYPSSLMGSIALIRQTLYDADWYARARQAFALDPQQQMPEFNAAIEALAGIDQGTIIFEGDENCQSVVRAQRLSDEFDIPFVIVAGGNEYAWLDDIKKMGATLIVPLNFPKAPEAGSFEDQLDLTLRRLRHWETAPTNPARLEEAGIRLALTTHRLKDKDKFWKNLRRAIGQGLSKETALRALTTVPAEICGVADMTGTLEPGMLASFFICDGDIFEKNVEVYATWVAGREYSFQPLETAGFAGEYQFSCEGIEATLHLTGKPSDPEGEMTIGGWTGELDNIDYDRTKISFACPLDSTSKAPVRFSGRRDGDSMSGRCVFADGRIGEWSAARTGDMADTDNRDDEKTPDSILAALTHPNAAFGLSQQPPREDILIRNATVWTADEDGILANTDILIRDGVFAAIGSDVAAPDGVRIIDAAGRHVTPGIIDAHSHLAISGDVNEGTFSITPDVRIGDVIDPETVNIYRQLAGGVTACLTLHGSANAIGGQCQVIKLRWGQGAEGLKYVQAPPTIKFALGENVKQSNWGEKFTKRYPQSRMGVEAIMRDVFQAAVEYKATWEHYRALGRKDQEKRIPPRRDLGLEAIVDVLESKLLLHCHTYVQSETLMLMRLAEEFGFTVDVFVHVLEGYKVADEMARHGASASTFSDWWAYKFEVYDAIPFNAGLMAERGVLTSLKSDNIDLARRLNQEAAKAVKYSGMERAEAIKLVTLNPARQLQIDEYTGSIRVGKEADFVIWNGDPLSIYSRVDETWIEGRKYFDRDEDDLMRQRIEEEKNRLIQKAIAASADYDDDDDE